MQKEVTSLHRIAERYGKSRIYIVLRHHQTVTQNPSIDTNLLIRSP